MAMVLERHSAPAAGWPGQPPGWPMSFAAPGIGFPPPGSYRPPPPPPIGFLPTPLLRHPPPNRFYAQPHQQLPAVTNQKTPSAATAAPMSTADSASPAPLASSTNIKITTPATAKLVAPVPSGLSPIRTGGGVLAALPRPVPAASSLGVKKSSEPASLYQGGSMPEKNLGTYRSVGTGTYLVNRQMEDYCQNSCNIFRKRH